MKTLADYEYYRTELGVLYCGDNSVVMPLIKEPIDLILTDPPYNALNMGVNQKVYDNTKMKLPEKEYRAFCKRWFKQAQRITPNIIFTPGCTNVWNYPKALWLGSWNKPGAVSYNKMSGYNESEPILYYGKLQQQKDTYRYTPNNFTNDISKEHPCPKNPFLWMDLIKANNKKQLILDPFMGSGTTAFTCERLGRKWIGIEISAAYAEIAKRRIEVEARQLKLFK